MKKLIIFFLYLFPVVGLAQVMGNLTGTVVDSDGQTWANSKWSANIVSPSAAIARYAATGLQVGSFRGVLDSSGSFTSGSRLPISDVSNIAPAGTCWSVTIQTNTSANPITLPCVRIHGDVDLGTYISERISPIRLKADKSLYAYSENEITDPVAGTGYTNTIFNTTWVYNGTGYVQVAGGGGTTSAQTGPRFALPCFNGPNSGSNYTVGNCGGLTSNASGDSLSAAASLGAPTVSAGGDTYDPQGTLFPNFKFPSSFSQGGYMSGFGRNMGNAGGWWKGSAYNQSTTILKSGIYQALNCALNKNSDGDSSCGYLYNNCDGGITAPSDEGCNGLNIQVRQVWFWTGHVRTYDAPGFTTGSLTNPVAFALPVEPTNGAHYSVTVGAPLLRAKTCTDTAHNNCTDAATYTGTLTGVSSAGAVGCSGAGYLETIPVTSLSTSLPLLSGWGCSGTLTLPDTGFNDGTQAIQSITLPIGSGSFHTGLAWIAGPMFPEPVNITAVGVISNGAQSVTLSYANPHPNGIILVQDNSGLVGQYLTADADLNYQPNPIPVFGSVDGTHIIVGLNVWGSVIANQYPVAASPAYCALISPANCTSLPNGAGTALTTGFHIYQGAPIIGTVPQGSPAWIDAFLGWNAVPWSATDSLTNPQNASFSGQGFSVLWQHSTPHANGKDDTPVHIVAGGAGFAGDQLIRIENSNQLNQYQNNGGALLPNEVMRVQGPFTATTFDLDTTPAYGSSMIEYHDFGMALGQTNQLLYAIRIDSSGDFIALQPDTHTWSMNNTLYVPNLVAGTGIVTTFIHEYLWTPPSSTSTCAAGDFRDDANYHYVCVATNQWKRVALSSDTW